MHIAAMKPIALNASDISQKDLNKEREIFLAQAKESGKPEDIIQKMVDGKIKKYISEVTLIDQKFVKDNEVFYKFFFIIVLSVDFRIRSKY